MQALREVLQQTLPSLTLIFSAYDPSKHACLSLLWDRHSSLDMPALSWKSKCSQQLNCCMTLGKLLPLFRSLS